MRSAVAEHTWSLWSFAVMAVLIAATAGIGYRNIETLVSTRQQAVETHKVLDALNLLMRNELGAESDVRGYIVTGDESYLETFEDSLSTTDQAVNELDSLTLQRPDQHQRALGLAAEVREKTEMMRQGIENRRKGFEAAQKLAQAGHGKQVMDLIKAGVEAMRLDENARLVEQRERFEHGADVAVISCGLCAIAGLLASLGFVQLDRLHWLARTRADQRLHEEKERFRTTLGSIGDAVIATDAECRISFINPVAEKLTGWAEEEVLGRLLDDIFVIVHETTREPAVNPARRALAEGMVVGLANHTVLIARDGSEYPIDDSAAPIKNGAEKDKPSGAVLVFRDVSERRGIETSLREADRQKDQFLAMLAHELRNPLAPLKNAWTIVRESRGDPDKLDYVGGVVERQMSHLVRLVDDLLDVSRITRNKIELRKEQLGAAALIESAVEISAPIVSEAGHQLRLSLPSPDFLVEVDRTRITQAISNLLNNAARFMEAGGLIHLQASREGDSLVVSVQDTGIGIPPDQMHGIFDMFAQVERAPGKPHGGLGVGLALTRLIAELHGGSVSADSAGANRGATFTLRLPVVMGELPLETPPPASPPTVSAFKRIVIADDNRDSADSLAILLELIGHEVHRAYDGIAAAEMIESVLPQVAFIDIGMPGLNGYQLATRLQNSPARPERLVAITGWGAEADRARAAAAGFDWHLVKPVDFKDVERLLSKMAAPEDQLSQ